MDWGGLKLLRLDRRKLATAIKDNVQGANYKAARTPLPSGHDQMYKIEDRELGDDQPLWIQVSKFKSAIEAAELISPALTMFRVVESLERRLRCLNSTNSRSRQLTHILVASQEWQALSSVMVLLVPPCWHGEYTNLDRRKR
jgi:hypothetical protein